MAELETAYHLYHAPRYRAADGGWHRTFREAVLHAGQRLEWEPAALLSTLAFGYVCGDLTPLRQVRRQPWLSTIGQDGEPCLLPIPLHNTLWDSYPRIARRLGDLLANEAERACQGYSDIYVLLSGGLDSRVTAGVIARLRKEGRLQTRPTAVTWGLEDSRDVVFARELARMLDMDWVHVPMEPGVVLRNIERCAESLAGMVLPVHLHVMEWFANVSPDALVLATSYGDSVGRAEYSAVHLLELKPHMPFNPGGLFAADAYARASQVLRHEIEALRARPPAQPDYAVREHEMHAFYTRGLLAHAMSSINDYCTVYQMFTDPAVYSYAWSLHPALRFNQIYAELLDQLDPRLARMPWARTNQGMKGTRNAPNGRLRPSFELYREWITGPLYQEIAQRIDLERIAAMGVFQMDAVRSLVKEACSVPGEDLPYKLSWFATLAHLSGWLESLGKQMQPGPARPPAPVVIDTAQAGQPAVRAVRPGLRRRVRQRLERSYWLRKWVRDMRRFWLRRRAVRAYPPVPVS